MNDSATSKLDQILKGIDLLNKKTDNTNIRIEELTTAINILQCENDSLKTKLNTLEAKLEYQENQLRRNNIIIYNMAENETENWLQTEEKVKDFVKQVCNIELQGKDIERAHRLRNQNTTKSNPRPIIAKFANFKTRDFIIRGARALKNTP